MEDGLIAVLVRTFSLPVPETQLKLAEAKESWFIPHVREESVNSPGFETGWVSKLRYHLLPGFCLHLSAWISSMLSPFSPLLFLPVKIVYFRLKLYLHSNTNGERLYFSPQFK